MESSPLPLVNSLDQIYTPAALVHEGQRWNSLFEAFQKEYGTPVQKVSRAPGRVNIIGEHIDYCGFSVLPAAIERDVLIAFSTEAPTSNDDDSIPKPSKPGKTVLVLRNMESKYTPTALEVDLTGNGDDLALPEKHHWSSYFIAGTKGILSHLFKTRSRNISTPVPGPERVLILVQGTVPEGSGLSSSSAMTTASAIAILEISGRRDGEHQVGRKDVTNVAIESERLVGVNSGGMDQSASVFSRPMHLLHIEFIPQLKARALPLPQTDPPFSFVIANTLVTSNKKLTAKYHYNLRVVECRLGALLLAKFLDLHVDYTTRPFPSYKTLVDTYFGHKGPTHGPIRSNSQRPEKLIPDGATHPALPSSRLPPRNAGGAHELRTMMGLVGQALGGPGMEDGMTWELVAEKLDVDAKELEKAVADREVEPKDGRFKIWPRARHVFSEALRVYEFKELLCNTAATSQRVTPEAVPDAEGTPVLETAASESLPDLPSAPLDPYSTSSLAVPKEDDPSAELLEKMGGLMNDSMESCQKDYECSCPELDELAHIARRNGAIGSRVTGAGWGGATVHLVREPDVPSFIKAIRSEYYAKRFPDLSEAELNDACFATKPENGAILYENEDAADHAH
ncbi:hypothetical protein JCM10908_006907 [Rhodotorula pacifica]|uniref:uncharacterized protein n=1 Tax=Rhodotorula pacifica TaxID=1495444 RepID=UPI00316C27F2